MELRGDSPVVHRLHIPFDGSEGRTEVMRYIRHDLFLIIIHVFELYSHKVERRRQIPHLIVRGHGDLVFQIPHGILLRRLGDLPERSVDKEMESQQKDKGQQEDDEQGDVDRNQQGAADLVK